MASAAWASLARAEGKQVKYGDLDVTLVRGNVTKDANLSARDFWGSVPDECSFDSSKGDFSYLQITGIPGTACIGWDNTGCSDTSWGDPDWTDIQNAMREIVAMDGQFSKSTAGAWMGTFFLFTTAFSERDTSLFNWFLGEMEGSSWNIYWSRDSDFASVTRNPECPSV